MKDFVLERSFEKVWIKKSRLDTSIETAPHNTVVEKYEVVLLDFLQNDFLSDVTLMNAKTAAAYK